MLCFISSSTSRDADSYVPVPLTSGKSLGIAYLEWMTLHGDVPAAVQDEYALLLIEGIPMQFDIDHRENIL